MEQLVQPNLSIVGYPDYCLAYVENVFGRNNSGKDADAFHAWQDSQFKHPGATPPGNVSVPVYWNWTGTIGGVTQDWGHVAVWVNGQVYTNPLTGSGHKVYPSIQALQTAYGLGSYLGWSEDLTTLRIVEETMQEVDLGTGRMFYFFFLGRNGENGKPNALNGDNDAEITKYWVGQPLTNENIASNLYNTPECNNFRNVELPEVYAKAAQAGDPTVLNAGLYEVK